MTDRPSSRKKRLLLLPKLRNPLLAVYHSNKLAAPMSFDAAALASAEALRLVSFTSSDAFDIGIELRQLISTKYAGKPAIIDIRAAADDQQVRRYFPLHASCERCHRSSPHLTSHSLTVYLSSHAQYFFAVCAEGSQPDNRHWAERKRRSVVRFGKSTASLRMKWPQGIPAHFAASEDDVRPPFSCRTRDAHFLTDEVHYSMRSTVADSPFGCRASNRSSEPSSCRA